MVYAIGFLGGFISGFFGSGGGLVLLPALIRILNIDEIKARGTTIATILIAVLISSIVYSKFHYLDIIIALKVSLGGIIGGFLGARMVNKIPKEMLSIVFDFFLLYASYKMIFGR